MATRQGYKEMVIRPAAYADPHLRSDGHRYLYAQLRGARFVFTVLSLQPRHTCVPVPEPCSTSTAVPK